METKTNKKMWRQVVFKPVETNLPYGYPVQTYNPTLELYLPANSLEEVQKMDLFKDQYQASLEILEMAMKQAGWDLLLRETAKALETQKKLEKNPELEKELSPLEKKHLEILMSKQEILEWDVKTANYLREVEYLIQQVMCLDLHPVDIELEEEYAEENEPEGDGAMNEEEVLINLDAMVGNVPDIILPEWMLRERKEYREKMEWLLRK